MIIPGDSKRNYKGTEDNQTVGNEVEMLEFFQMYKEFSREVDGECNESFHCRPALIDN
jgi:hypothetical protein